MASCSIIMFCLQGESYSGGSSTSEVDYREIDKLKEEIIVLNKEKQALQLELGSQSDTEQVNMSFLGIM